MGKSEKKEARHRVPIGPRVKAVLRIAYRARRAVLLEGPTGIGKSEVVQQVAEELGIEWRILDLSLLEPPDLVGLPVIDNGRTTYAPPKLLPIDGKGILLLEELNRAERYIQQPALQLLTARRLHEYVLPEGWGVAAAINPERGEYQVTPLDPALRCRFIVLEVCADRVCWMEWARGHGIHAAVLRLADDHEQFFDHVPPRTWAYVSDVLQVMDSGEWEDPVRMHDIFSGTLSSPLVQVLLKALQETGDQQIDVRRLLIGYHKDPQSQAEVRAYRDGGQTDRLNQIACRLRAIVCGPELNQLIGRGEFCLEAFEALLADLPGDHREDLVERLGGNLLAARLLDVQPADILHGGYAGGHLAKLVSHWAADPCKRHRVKLLVSALCHHLQNTADISSLRNSTGARIALGHFLQQVGTELAKPLRAVTDRYSLETITSEARRKPR